ncbi:hypothetical protein GCM10010435_69900 [Winogradskya consettensis]|uniref:SCP domain-containing protein n=1 Tax=Winogradskya consettensis TaxID=113560 RepID=A0A919SND8_9ACTN|nr:CAP domain-containing protein [Actinoplanes consettensis]GIM75607.1 hypothetical protein Aco04nite_46200 [Actinoplanes consettensis]
MIAEGGDPDGDVQRQALKLINAHRQAGGCADLGLDRKLIAAADGHAADMARHDYFAHEDRSGAQAGQRLDHAGYRWRRYSENIARGQSSVRAVVDAWWHSPAHRENIMDCGLRETGFGLAFAADRTPFWVQVSAVPITTS